MERRVLLAITLSFLVLFLFQRFVLPPAPSPSTASSPPAAATSTLNAPAPDTAKPETPSNSPSAGAVVPASAPLGEMSVADKEERTITVETATVRAVFTNRGAGLLSWVVKGYRAEDGSGLDLVPTGAGPNAPRA